MPSFRFVNVDGSTPQAIGSVLKWMVGDRLAGRRRKSPDRAEVPHVKTNTEALKTPPREGARLTWLGHASWLIQLDGVNLLIDPVLGESISGVVKRNVPAPVRVQDLPKIDACLVSHNHRDHLDLPTLKQAGVEVISGTGTQSLLRSNGLGGRELAWWQSLDVGAVKVHFVPSQHWSRRGLADTNEMLWGGFVIEGKNARIYHSGDTAYFDGFKEIGKRLGPIDAALLPIGAYDPSWFMEKQHMNPEQAIAAFVDLQAKHFFAMHWGTFKLTDEPLDEPPVRARAEWKRRNLPEDRLSILAVGETFSQPVTHANGDVGLVPSK